MKEISLNGEWTLTGKGNVEVPPIPAQVPGNIEIDLEKAGIVPELSASDNVKALRPFEFNDWSYAREFDCPADFPAGADLVCEGVDCVAEIYLNGALVASPKNALIRHAVKIDETLNRGGRNTIEVKIKSSPLHIANNFKFDSTSFSPVEYEGIFLRKPTHAYGWDITPRMALGGIWRDIAIKERPANRMVDCFFDVREDSTAECAQVIFSYQFVTDMTSWDVFEIEIDGVCGDSHFTHKCNQLMTGGNFLFRVENPKLWFPAGYGEQNLYDLTVTVRHRGETFCSAKRSVGIRTIKVDYSENPDDLRFCFVVNGVRIMALGTNWVPADALHSRDKARITNMLELARELRCNMMRVWGGGVYEDPLLYDYCDRHGILIWQDFMGAAYPPQQQWFLDSYREEAEWAVRELRQHPCVALWSGDNEMDIYVYETKRGVKPSRNRLTREIIPQVLDRLDPSRFYLPSSPYVSPEAERNKPLHVNFPESHPWGPRCWAKDPYYRGITSAFISEIGFHSAAALESIKAMIPADELWPVKRTPAWDAHSPNSFWWNVELLLGSFKQFFDEEPQSLEDMVEGSQIDCGENLKFMIELVRSQKGKKSGILWWNLMDSWPQIPTPAIVDYYFRKKKAFDFVRRAQQPVLVMLKEWSQWRQDVVLCNDTMKSIAGKVVITDSDSNEVVFEKNFSTAANDNAVLGKIEIPNCARRMLIIKWTLEDGHSGLSHHLCGHTPHSLPRLKGFFKTVDALELEIAKPQA